MQIYPQRGMLNEDRILKSIDSPPAYFFDAQEIIPVEVIEAMNATLTTGIDRSVAIQWKDRSLLVYCVKGAAETVRVTIFDLTHFIQSISVQPLPTRKPRILLIESNDVVRMVIGKDLAEAGYDVAGAPSCQTAKDWMSRPNREVRPYNIVVLSAYTAGAKEHLAEHPSELPLILLTSSDPHWWSSVNSASEQAVEYPKNFRTVPRSNPIQIAPIVQAIKELLPTP